MLAKNLHKRLDSFEALYKKTKHVEFNIPVWRKAAQICAALIQQGNMIDDADILIAAFCLANNFTLVTNNLRHFERIDGVKLVNWKYTDD